MYVNQARIEVARMQDASRRRATLPWLFHKGCNDCALAIRAILFDEGERIHNRAETSARAQRVGLGL